MLVGWLAGWLVAWLVLVQCDPAKTNRPQLHPGQPLAQPHQSSPLRSSAVAPNGKATAAWCNLAAAREDARGNITVKALEVISDDMAVEAEMGVDFSRAVKVGASGGEAKKVEELCSVSCGTGEKKSAVFLRKSEPARNMRCFVKCAWEKPASIG
ncbi:unnamed protein product [Cladocopium goreaui]|uniref:Uncharacterized protein n=1 Tax=Cladocopium goreaui TaxID=2562237 RepID=A0A9P1C8A8_9DINO|nr:unnamed protein product [Cladocopium goreaui]